MTLHHVALRVRDCALAARFYSLLTGARRMRTTRGADGSARAVWLRVGDLVLMLERTLRGAGDRRGSGHVLVFGAASTGDAEERFARAGARVNERTAFTLYSRDPDGHRVGLSCFRFPFLARKRRSPVLVSAADAGGSGPARGGGRTRNTRAPRRPAPAH